MGWLKTKPSEDDEQGKYFDHVRMLANQDWRYGAIFAVPNGAKLPYVNIFKNGKRIRVCKEARRLIATGLRPGAWDIHIPLRSGRYIGAWIEMKLPGESLSSEQVAWGDMMSSAGHLLHVARSGEDAMEFTRFYFDLEKQRLKGAA